MSTTKKTKRSPQQLMTDVCEAAITSPQGFITNIEAYSHIAPFLTHGTAEFAILLKHLPRDIVRVEGDRIVALVSA
jgi:hypothetical protein